MKLTARERKLKPVEARAFFFSKNASELGTVGVEASSVDLIFIYRGELGEGGELERVVAELLFMDHRRTGVLRWPPSARFVSEVAPSEPNTALPLLSVSCELVRRKILDIVRLKLELDPRVERLDSGMELGSCSADGVAGVGVDGFGVGLENVLLFLRGGVVLVAAVVFKSKGGFVSGTATGRPVEKVAGVWWSTESESWFVSG